jgi:hypothetical protein
MLAKVHRDDVDLSGLLKWKMTSEEDFIFEFPQLARALRAPQVFKSRFVEVNW